MSGKLGNSQRNHLQRGATMLEIVLAVAVIGILSTMANPIFSSWRLTASTKTCIFNQASVQESMRMFCGINNRVAGAALTNTEFIGNAYPALMAPPTCGGGYVYTYRTTVPVVGVAYMNCSQLLHTPTTIAGW